MYGHMLSPAAGLGDGLAQAMHATVRALRRTDHPSTAQSRSSA